MKLLTESMEGGGKWVSSYGKYYNPQTTAYICTEIASGRSVLDICSEPGMPPSETVYKWVLRHPEFAAEYALARKSWALHQADLLIKIADEANPFHAAATRQRIVARQYLMGKYLPELFGDKKITETTKLGDGRVVTRSLSNRVSEIENASDAASLYLSLVNDPDADMSELLEHEAVAE